MIPICIEQLRATRIYYTISDKQFPVFDLFEAYFSIHF